MIGAAGLRWNIEDDNKAGKDQLGLDQYQVRKWTPGTGTSRSACSPTRSSPLPAPTWERPQSRADRGHQLIPEALIGYSLAENRGLLAATVLARDGLDHDAAITRDLWRRNHQTRALISHYKLRGDPLPQDLRM